jgi:TolA-binding protein
MSHISELYKKIEELQKQMDVIKEQNDKFQDIVDQAGGVLDDALPVKDANEDTGSAPATNSAKGCGVKLNYKEQTVLKSITTQLRTKRIVTIKLLNFIDRMLKNDPHFVQQVNKEKTS